MTRTGTMCAAGGLALLVGGAVFFAAIVTPSVFADLPPDAAAAYLRSLFPLFYAYSAAASMLALAGFAIRREPRSAGLMAGVLAGFAWAGLWLIPRMNEWRLAGDQAAFGWGHSISVWLFALQIIAAVWLLLRLALKATT